MHKPADRKCLAVKPVNEKGKLGFF